MKQQFNYGTIQKICHLHNDIFHHIQLCHTLLILLYQHQGIKQAVFEIGNRF